MLLGADAEVRRAARQVVALQARVARGQGVAAQGEALAAGADIDAHQAVLTVVEVLARLAHALLAPFALGSRFRAAISDLGWPPRLARAGGEGSDNMDFQELGNELVIHDKRSGDVHVLNSVAHAIFGWAKEGLDSDAIVAKLVAAYPEEDPEDIRAGVKNVMETLASLEVLR